MIKYAKLLKKVQQKLLHFFVRYAIMYHSDVQMSLLGKQKKAEVFGGTLWKGKQFILL